VVLVPRIWIEFQKNTYSLGEEVSGVVHLSMDKPISQRGAGIFLMGKERTEISYQKTVQTGQTHQTRTETAVQESGFLNQQYPMPLPTDEKGKCAVGEHSFPFKFTLQQGLPTTYRGRYARIVYTVSAKIDVPMGMDVNGSSEFNVISSNLQPYQAAPINAYSNSWGNQQSAGISFTLDRGQYARGEVISGKCFFRTASKDVRKIDVALRWVETASAQNQRATSEIMKELSQVPAGGGTFQGESTFSVSVPPQAPPTYEATLSNVRCTLTASMDIAMGLDVAASQAIKIVETAGFGGQPAPQYPYGQYAPTTATPVQPPQPVGYPAPTAAVMRCPRCGATIAKSNSQYCPQCGSRL
jgi:hypothetical protein